MSTMKQRIACLGVLIVVPLAAQTHSSALRAGATAATGQKAPRFARYREIRDLWFLPENEK